MTENIWDIFQRARKYYNQNSLLSKLHLYVVIVLSNIAERSLELENICNIYFFIVMPFPVIVLDLLFIC